MKLKDYLARLNYKLSDLADEIIYIFPSAAAFNEWQDAIRARYGTMQGHYIHSNQETVTDAWNLLEKYDHYIYSYSPELELNIESMKLFKHPWCSETDPFYEAFIMKAGEKDET